MNMSNDLFYLMVRLPPQREVCRDEFYIYYSLHIYGLDLLYRQNRWRNDGERMYQFNNSLARLLGYASLADMMRGCKLQYWRGYVTARTLRKRLARIGGNWCLD